MIRTASEQQFIGSFVGQRFDAEVETDRGKSSLVFLVTKRLNENLN